MKTILAMVILLALPIHAVAQTKKFDLADTRQRKVQPRLKIRADGDRISQAKWFSPLLGRSIRSRVHLPSKGNGNHAVVVYLKNLPSRRLGSLDDATLIKQFLEDKMMVIEVDYGSDERAAAPQLLPEIDAWYSYLYEAYDLPVDRDWIYVLPAGYTIDRGGKVCDIPGREMRMDVIYPSGTCNPVPLMLQITSNKDRGKWINQRAYYIYGLLATGYAGAIMDYNGGTLVSPKGEVFPEKRTARLLRANAKKWNLSGKLGVTGHSKGSSRAAKAAFINNGECEKDAGPHADQSDRFQAVLLSAGQHATEFLIEDGFLDEIGSRKRASAERSLRNLSEEDVQRLSTLSYVTRDDPPAFLCVGAKDKKFRVAQMRRLAKKCKTIGLGHELVVQPNMPHQYIDDPKVIGRIIAFLDKQLK